MKRPLKIILMLSCVRYTASFHLPFKGVDAARIRYLTDDEVTRLMNACEPEFRPMVQAAVLTGARYGELGRLTAADYDLDAGTLFIAASKSDQSRHVVLNEEGQQFFSRACLDHASDDLLFVKADGNGSGAYPLHRGLDAGSHSPPRSTSEYLLPVILHPRIVARCRCTVF